MRPLRFLLAVALACTALATFSSGALAYGRADQPLAQIEISANCTNRNSSLCAPGQFGLGGIWLWVEVDANGTADVAGAGCGHLDPVFGSGAESIRGEIPNGWTYYSGTPADLMAAFPGTLVVGTDPGSEYYVLPEFGFAFPTTTGHYSLTLDKGVFVQAQVAP